MLFSFAFGAGQGLAPPGNALLMGAIFVLFILAPPGRVLGLDAHAAGPLPALDGLAATAPGSRFVRARYTLSVSLDPAGSSRR